MPRKKNPFAKTREVDNPYAVYTDGVFTYHVLKTYKHPQNELKDKYARWFVAGKSPYTHGSWEYGDSYAKEIENNMHLVNSDDEWFKMHVMMEYE